MSYSYELASTDPAERAVADVRLYSTDNSGAEKAILSDEEISVFLRDCGGATKLAAAASLEFIAARTNLVWKKAKVGEIETDAPAVAKELRAQAQALRAQYAAEVAAVAESETSFFEIVPNSGSFYGAFCGDFS